MECKQKCTSEKICNPASGRCVLKTGAIGKKLLPGNSAVAKNTKYAKNTTVRKHPETGAVQSIPASKYARKAPRGHAKNYNGQVHTGQDGNPWISKKTTQGVSRWVPHKTTTTAAATMTHGKKTHNNTASGAKQCAPCPSDKVCNPKSGRCVLKTGAVGKAMHNIVSHITSSSHAKTHNNTASGAKQCAPCPSDKVCNPKSGRCVLKTGAIGKALHNIVSHITSSSHTRGSSTMGHPNAKYTLESLLDDAAYEGPDGEQYRKELIGKKVLVALRKNDETKKVKLEVWTIRQIPESEAERKIAYERFIFPGRKFPKWRPYIVSVELPGPYHEIHPNDTEESTVTLRELKRLHSKAIEWCSRFPRAPKCTLEKQMSARRVSFSANTKKHNGKA